MNGKKLLSAFLLVSLTGCGTMGNVLNPFYDSPTPEAQLGERSDRALNEGDNKADKARTALESMAAYRRAQPPAPYDPVLQPAVVRLMWIPDHLNVHGDLVPAHFYYLKVLSDRFAVQDAFELQSQLNGKGGAGAGNVPFTTKDDIDANR